MKKRSLILILLVLFSWQTLAQAASISTRVRILESKVKKLDRHIQHQNILLKKQDKKFMKGGKDIQHLQNEIAFLKHQQQILLQRAQSKHANHSGTEGEASPNHYSFP